jgi:hypothetical protein
MNTYEIDWNLDLSKHEALHLLSGIIQPPEKLDLNFKRPKGEITSNEFTFDIKHTPVWGLSFRKEIQGRGTIDSANEGSRITAIIEICAPYKYVNINNSSGIAIGLLFILSLVGLISSHIWSGMPAFIEYLFFLVFFVICFILVIGSIKHLMINDKFKEIINAFEQTFSKHRIKER